jgi:hypothetical protein
LDDTVYRIDDDSLNEIAAEILESDTCPPKLQIVFHTDHNKYYAINNSHLQIYKQLQLSGLITHVQADVINIEAIPHALRQHLFQAAPSNVVATAAATSSTHNDGTGDEIDDDDDEDDEDGDLNLSSNSSCVASSSSSSGPCNPSTKHSSNIGTATVSITNGNLADILTADVLSPSTIEMLTKEMLVDETYEFGQCDNCVQSDHENDDQDQDEKKINSNNGDENVELNGQRRIKLGSGK